MKLEQTFRRIYAIPDIHGRYDLLSQAFALMTEDGLDLVTDAIIVVGDMIDRGPDSKDVLEFLIFLQVMHPDNVFVVRGNHDDFAVNALAGNDFSIRQLWYMNGGGTTQNSYPNGSMSDEHIRFLGGLPYSVEVQGFFFSHAPVPREHKRNGRKSLWGDAYGKKGEPYTVWERTWHYIGPECERPGSYMDVHEGPKSDNGTGPDHLIGICGHIHRLPHLMEVRIFKNYRMLDSGCGCMAEAPLAIHECISGKTIYARP